MKRHQAGLAKLIILIVIAILILSYWGINIQNIAESETGRANFNYIWQIILKIWEKVVDLYQTHIASWLNQKADALLPDKELINWLKK